MWPTQVTTEDSQSQGACVCVCVCGGGVVYFLMLHSEDQNALFTSRFWLVRLGLGSRVKSFRRAWG